MNRSDPFDPPEGYIYECRECHTRMETDERIGTCEECGGAVKNIAVPRE